MYQKRDKAETKNAHVDDSQSPQKLPVKWVVSFGLILRWLHAIFHEEKHLKIYVLKHENELYLP